MPTTTLQANQTLLDEHELIDFSASDEHSAARERVQFISTKEELLFNEYLGWQFYMDLMGSKIPYGNTENPYVNYRENTNYAVDTIVLYKFKLYKVTVATDGSQKPPLTTHFEIAPKFDNDYYNFMWIRYLGQILASTIMYSTLMYRLIKDTSRGIVKNYQDGSSKAATVGEVHALKREAKIDIEDIVKNMDKYVARNKDQFPNYRVLDTTSDANCVTEKKVSNSRFYGFNVTT